MYGGWLTATFAVFQLVAGPVLGSLSDHYGRRPVLLLSLAAFGCKKKGDCDSAINNMMEVSKADMAKGMDDKMMDKMKGIAMSHCKDDKWPDDALKCMKEAKSNADATPPFPAPSTATRIRACTLDVHGPGWPR